MHRHIITCAVGAGLVLQGCSSRPREFSPTFAAAPADRAAFDADFSTCQQLLVAGKLDSNGRAASGAAGAAAGGAVAVAGGALATSMVPAVGMALASATIVLLPFAVVGGALGMAKRKKTQKEKAIATAMNGCLAERGHVITGWEKSKKRS